MAPAAELKHGAYVLADTDSDPDIILIASGSEVSLVLGAREQLAKLGVKARVVSMPSWELFEAQPAEYRQRLFPPQVTARLAVEAAVPLGWERYVGQKGAVIGINRFGASAPYQVLMEHFGFTIENVTRRALALLAEA